MSHTNISKTAAIINPISASPASWFRLRLCAVIVPFLSLLCQWSASAAIKVSGTVCEKISGEPLAGATVTYGRTTGTSTNPDGTFEFTADAGELTVTCSYIGYETVTKHLTVNADTTIVVEMIQSANELADVVVLAKSVMDRVRSTQPGIERIDIDEMAKTPVLFGERDIIKSLELLPGVSEEGRGMGGFEVRGGTPNQNLVLLDGAPIINPSHLFGFFSAFNNEGISGATLYKGQLPARYSNATSSVLDVTTKAGDMNNYHGLFSIGLLSAKFNVSGPIVNDKLSFSVAARRSYMDMFLKLTDQFNDNSLYFYDINAKLNYAVDRNNRVAVSFFLGRDKLGMNDMNMTWGNLSATANWYHIYNDRISSNLILYHSVFSDDMMMQITSENDKMTGHLKQTGLRYQFAWNPTDAHNVDFGITASFLNLKSGEWPNGISTDKEQRRSLDAGIWINDDWSITRHLHLLGGVRLGLFSPMGGAPYYEVDDNGNITDVISVPAGKPVKTYLSIEPRLSLNWQITDLQSAKVAYSRSSQNIHAMRTTGFSMPFDRYAMTSNIIRPQTANQISGGYVTLFGNSRWEASAEAFYKHIDNIYDYRDGKSFNSEIEIERLILGGKGRAYGLELSLRKNAGRFTGWVGYTLSWVESKINGISNGKWYTASNDRRHDLSVVAIYEINNRWNLSGSWVFSTGQALTAPSAKYEVDGIHLFHYAERNGYRAPTYHHLDLSATYTHAGPKLTYEWSFGIYNAYARFNPFIILFKNDDNSPTGFKTTKLTLFGFIPSVSYTLKF